MRNWIILAGIGQIAIALASLAIPRILRWREDLASLRPLTRQVFWTYAAYIWSINLAFGLVSIFAAHILLDGSTLARAVCTFIALYWGARLAIQLFWFDRSSAPQGLHVRLAEILLTTAFAAFTLIYGWAALGA